MVRRAVLLALLVLGTLALVPIGATRVVRHRVVEKLEAKLGRQVVIDDIALRLGRLELYGLVVEGTGGPAPLEVAHATVFVSLGSLLAGDPSIDRLVLEEPRIHWIRGAAGEDNISSILARLRGDGRRGATSTGRSIWPRQVDVRRGVLQVFDEELGSIEARSFDARLVRDRRGEVRFDDLRAGIGSGPAIGAGRLEASVGLQGFQPTRLEALSVSAGTVSFWKGFTLTGVEGGIAPDKQGQSKIAMRGGYGNVDRVLWEASGSADLARRQGRLSLRAERFDLGQLSPILSDTPIIDPQLAEVDARLDLTFRGDPAPDHLRDALDFEGHAHLSGLSLFHPMLGPSPVRHLGFDASGKGRLEPRARRIEIDGAQLDVRGVRASIAARAEKLGRRPAFDARLVIAPIPCQVALGALPPELTPALQGFRVAGTFKTDLHAAIDLSDLDQGVALGGSVGVEGCKVVEAPPLADAERLSGSFEQAVEVEPGEWIAFLVGPDNPDWVPYAEISPSLVNAIMTTEDSSFFRHHGFIPSEFSSALKANLQHGYFRLGASSITMQMVKNVLLSREKTLSRKLQELFLTWYVEHHLSKERILELYFNVIEFGPRLYGIGRAARHYFGKAAKDLTPREAAWFSSILPNPKRRYVHFCRGAPDAKWELYLNRILKRMHERGRLGDLEHEQALAERLQFDRAEAIPERDCLELVKRLTTPIAHTLEMATGEAEGEE